MSFRNARRSGCGPGSGREHHWRSCIGKSRLLLEFWQRIGDRASWSRHSVSFGQSMAFHPVIYSMRRSFWIEEQDPAEVVRASSGGRRAHRARARTRLPYVFYMLGVAEASDPVQHIDPQFAGGDLRWPEAVAAARRRAETAGDGLRGPPLVGQRHQRFLTFLIDSIPRSRVLILLTLRPGHDLVLADAPMRRGSSCEPVRGGIGRDDGGGAGVCRPATGAACSRSAQGRGQSVLCRGADQSLGETGAILRRGERWRSVGHSIRSLSRTRSRTC